ncbi:MAG: hypothetical protein V2J25_15260 [Desulfatiglans sp.]|nr:STAS/SEC14 domain-containing protein [Thermodesulfobacteriota bacterium]MEE4354218.1 hypothetical protein [Desulfatiglans sp.]
MNDFIDIKRGKDLVHAHFRGPVTLERLDELMVKTTEKAKEWGFNKYLVDFREADERRVTTSDDYDLAYMKFEQYGFEPGSKHALLVRDDKEMDQWRFVETVFRNAGHNLRIFTEEQKAFEWI